MSPAQRRERTVRKQNILYIRYPCKHGRKVSSFRFHPPEPLPRSRRQNSLGTVFSWRRPAYGNAPFYLLPYARFLWYTFRSDGRNKGRSRPIFTLSMATSSTRSKRSCTQLTTGGVSLQCKRYIIVCGKFTGFHNAFPYGFPFAQIIFLFGYFPDFLTAWRSWQYPLSQKSAQKIADKRGHDPYGGDISISSASSRHSFK